MATRTRPAYSLVREDLQRGVVHMASANGLAPLFSTLEANAPISIGLLGASVGQDGGCLNQPGKRCNDYSGRIKTAVPWASHKMHYAGFFVRLFDSLNSTWPHAQHELTNGAADGTPPQTILDCLFSHLPRRLHMVIFEFGSMARYLDFAAVEALVRVLLSLRPRPVLVFLTVREWCRADKVAFGSKARPFLDNETTAWSRAESKFGMLCAHYDLSCLSYYHALSRGFHAREPGFGYDEIAQDCLHPLSGTRGTDVMADLLLFWQRAALRRVRAARAHAPRPVLQLPPPLQDERKVGYMQSLARNARCYSLLESGTAKRFRLVYQRTQPLPWRTAHCAHDAPLAHSNALSLHTARCTHVDENVECNNAYARRFLSRAQVWFFCFAAFRPDGTPGKKVGAARVRARGRVGLLRPCDGGVCCCGRVTVACAAVGV
jgi:hypothetical protein